MISPSYTLLPFSTSNYFYIDTTGFNQLPVSTDNFDLYLNHVAFLIMSKKHYHIISIWNNHSIY